MSVSGRRKTSPYRTSAVLLAAVFLICGLLAYAAFAAEPSAVSEIKSEGLVSATLNENAGLSFALVAVAGLLDGVNPCSVHLTLLLVGYLLLFVKDRKRATRIGFVFIITIFLTYFLFGALFSSAIISLMQNPNYPLVRQYLTYFLAALLAVSGVINLKDSIFGRKTTIDLTSSEESFIARKISQLHFPGTVLLAFLSTLFLLPCSLPLYLGSIHIISQTFGQATVIFYIFVYSLMFVVPLYLVLSVLLRAEQYVKVEDFAPDKFRKLRFIESVVQLLIAAALILF